MKDRSSWGPVADGSVTIDRWDGQKVQMYTYDNIDAYFQKGTSFNEGVLFSRAMMGRRYSPQLIALMIRASFRVHH